MKTTSNKWMVWALGIGLAAASGVEAKDFSMRTSESDVQVKLSTAEKRVEVTVVNQKRLQLPNYVKITLRDQKGGERELDLSLAEPNGTELGRYLGSLPQNQDSYVSVKLVIPFQGKKPTILDSIQHSVPVKK